MIDIIGNALADEAAELAAALLRPTQEKIILAKQVDELAFAVCLRLGFVQARLWDLFGNAPIYERPATFDNEPITDEEALQRLLRRMKESGHVLERGMRGKLHGLRCCQCHEFHRHTDFAKWNKKCRPKAATDSIVITQRAKRLYKEKVISNELCVMRKSRRPLAATLRSIRTSFLQRKTTRPRRTKSTRILVSFQSSKEGQLF